MDSRRRRLLNRFLILRLCVSHHVYCHQDRLLRGWRRRISGAIYKAEFWRGGRRFYRDAEEDDESSDNYINGQLESQTAGFCSRALSGSDLLNVVSRSEPWPTAFRLSHAESSKRILQIKPHIYGYCVETYFSAYPRAPASEGGAVHIINFLYRRVLQLNCSLGLDFFQFS